MQCDLFECCLFFDENMKGLPTAAEMLKKKFCFDDFQSCRRYRMYHDGHAGMTPPDLFPGDEDVVEKVIRCMESKRAAGGSGDNRGERCCEGCHHL